MIKRILLKVRTWLAPVLLVCMVGLLLIGIAFWVLRAASDRELEQNVEMLERRIQWQLGGVGPWAAQPQDVFETLASEVLSDPRVQAVCIFDYTREKPFRVRRHADIVVPQTAADIDAMLNADPASIRYKRVWRFDLQRLRADVSRREKRAVGEEEVRAALMKAGVPADMLRGFIYVDFSAPAIRQEFWALSKPLMKRVAAFTAVAVVGLGALAVLAWMSMHRAGRIRQRALLEQQGMLAQRGLTAAVLAHEIRNPLGALRFQLHSLRRNAADPQRVGQTADTIDGELSRIQQLVSDYLAHEKAQTMRVAEVNLSDAARGVQTLMGEMLADSRTQLVVADPPSPVRVMCDPHMLRQVLINLVLNAQQAMGTGGRITIHLGQVDGAGQIEVTDSGPGIPPEMKDRIFKPFQTSKKEGSGIGLALVKRFVDNFSGSVAVESELGRGTTFRLRLPLAGQDGQGGQAGDDPVAARPPVPGNVGGSV